MLWVSIFLFADITQEYKVNQENSVVRISGENSVHKDADRICITYCKKRGYEGLLELAISEDDGETFTYLEIDTLYTQTPENPDIFLPQLKKLNQYNICIVYNKLTEDNNIVLCKAKLSFLTDILTKSIVADSLTSSPILSKNADDFNVYYFYSNQENSSEYCYFTDRFVYKDPNDSIAFIWGRDTIYGNLHSNTKLILQGFSHPTIKGRTTSHKRIIHDNGNDANCYDTEMFREGAYPYTKKKNLSGTADELREIASTPFDSTADIVYVKINGSNYQSMQGYISESQIQVPVYSWYPADDAQARDIINDGGNWFEDAIVIWNNTVTIYDTTWTVGPSGQAENNQFWTESTLWIEGTVTGKQTWGSAEDVYLTSDILYTNTAPGMHPDGYNPSLDDFSNPVNSTDYCGIVSEGVIYIKYKHRDPFQNNLLRDDNCNDIRIYASLAAIGYGDTESGPDSWRNVSTITYEYQDPHKGLKDFQSISPYTQNDTTYSNVIYHRYILNDPSIVPDSLQMYCLRNLPSYVYGFTDTTQAAINPLYHNNYPNIPASTCPAMYAYELPEYSPVGPEDHSDIGFERGHVSFFGALVSRRARFTHSSGDNCDHTGALWDIENFKFGLFTYSNGYSRGHYYDQRLRNNEIPGFPKLYSLTYGGNSLLDNSELLNVSQQVESFAKNCDSGCYAKSDSLLILFFQREDSDRQLKEFDIYYSIDNGQNFEYRLLSVNSQELVLRDIEISDDEIFVLLHNHADMTDIVYVYNKTANVLNEHSRIRSDFGVSDLAFFSNNEFLIAAPEHDVDTQIAFYSENNLSNASMYWNPFFIDDTSDSPVKEIQLTISENDSIMVSMQTNTINGWGDFYIGNGLYVNTPNKENVNTVEKYSICNYPNPFNPETTISYTVPKDADVEISIYNIKGQKVKTILNEKVLKGNHSIIWNGVDSSNKPVSSGVYFYKLNVENKAIKVNKCILMK